MSENRYVCVFLRANFVSFLVLVFRLLFYTRKKVGAGQGSVSDFFFIHSLRSCFFFLFRVHAWEAFLGWTRVEVERFRCMYFLVIYLDEGGIEFFFLNPHRNIVFS
jgi:hypothetical protein